MRKLDIKQFLTDQINRGNGIRYMSRQTGLSASTIHRIASGKVSPTLETVEKILALFDYVLLCEYKDDLKQL